MSEIANITARRVWDSRGRPTVEADVTLSTGVRGRAIAPAGASRGTREAMDLRDGGTRLGGMDVTHAISNVTGPIAGALRGMDVQDQTAVDAALVSLDPSPLKDTLGGNATVATSLAVLDAAARDRAVPVWKHVSDLCHTVPSIPLPEVQIFGGGAHAGRRVDIQDFMIVVPGATDFDMAMEITREVYFAAGDIIAAQGRSAGVADEGGWWPDFDTNEQALAVLVAAIEKAGERPGDNVAISLDIAASEFWADGRYRLALDDNALDTEGLINLLGRWIDTYPIVSIEDPLSEHDTDGMVEFTRRHGDRLQIIGDDYLVTNADLVTAAAADGACNAVLVKVNQAGTVSEAFDTFAAAQTSDWRAIVSARSGETEDVAISHLSVGLGCGQLKVGSFQRSERMAKWNEVLRIQEDLGRAAFVGGRPLSKTWWGKNAAGKQK